MQVWSRYSPDSKIRLEDSSNTWASGLRYLDLYQHFPTLNLDQVQVELGGRIVHGLSRCRIPSPSMPRTHNLSLLDHALPERAASMQADVIHCGQGAIHISDADRSVATRKLTGFVARRQFCRGSDSDEWHGEATGLARSSYFGCRVCAIIT